MADDASIPRGDDTRRVGLDLSSKLFGLDPGHGRLRRGILYLFTFLRIAIFSSCCFSGRDREQSLLQCVSQGHPLFTQAFRPDACLSIDRAARHQSSHLTNSGLFVLTILPLVVEGIILDPLFLFLFLCLDSLLLLVVIIIIVISSKELGISLVVRVGAVHVDLVAIARGLRADGSHILLELQPQHQ